MAMLPLVCSRIPELASLNKPKRIMVDMSATLIRYGHICLLRAAKKLGTVIVALTTDDEIALKRVIHLSLTLKKDERYLRLLSM